MVYVGTRQYKYGRMKMSHMASDTLYELHEMAQAIGVDRKHFQDKPGKPHYDICQKMKRKAMELGAKEVDDRELIKLYRNMKTGVPFSEFGAFCTWLDDNGWYQVNDFEFDNSESPNSCFRASIEGLYLQYFESKK